MTHRCEMIVYVRDTYRRTGRGRSGFELHYTKRQCSRAAKVVGFCLQHARIAGFQNARMARESAASRIATTDSPSEAKP